MIPSRPVRICLVAQSEEQIIIIPLESVDVHRFEMVSPIPRDSLSVVIVSIFNPSFTTARFP